ncbi:MAG TPA: DUF4388 domain-containing protein [Polyangiaceae bacterium]|nr:DUF4388 domain-containing protein [Polyangiaceae bacterium]
MVVCSQAWVARLVAGALEARALQVSVFATVADALAGLRHPLDALVCDASLPGGPAELVEGLRKSAQGAPVPVLCLVPDEPSGGRLAALQAGVDLCLAQPFRVDELVAQVEALLALAARLRAPASSALRPPPPPSLGPRSATPPRASLAPSTPRPGSSWGPPSARRAGPSAPPPAAQRAAPPSLPPAAPRPTSNLPPAPRPETPPPPSALEGDLAHVSLSTVLSLLEMERRSGVIAIDDGGRQSATIDLCFGSPVGGSLAGARVAPLAVLRQVLSWTRGRFRFDPGPVADVRTGGRSLGALLIEALRLADESAAADEALRGLDDPGPPAPSSRQSSPPARARSPSTLDEPTASSKPAALSARPSRPPLSSVTDSSMPPPI